MTELIGSDLLNIRCTLVKIFFLFAFVNLMRMSFGQIKQAIHYYYYYSSRLLGHIWLAILRASSKLFESQAFDTESVFFTEITVP